MAKRNIGNITELKNRDNKTNKIDIFNPTLASRGE